MIYFCQFVKLLYLQRLDYLILSIIIKIFNTIKMSIDKSIHEKNSIDYSIKISKPTHQTKTTQYNKKMPMVNKHLNRSDEAIKYDEPNSSAYVMKQSDSSKMMQDDHFQLPKVHFQPPEQSINLSKTSLVNVKLPQNDQDSPDPHVVGSTAHRSQQMETDLFQEDKGWSGWNINNIKTIPSQNNYLESQYALIPIFDSNKKKRDRKSSRELERIMQRRQQERNFQMVSNFLSGKASVVWLFVLGPEISQHQIEQVRKIYNSYIDNDYEVPICRSYQEACKFLNLQNCFFKVVADLNSSEPFLEDTLPNKNIASIYIYNPKKVEGINRVFALRKNSRRIKGMFNTLQEVTKQAQDDIENEAKFIKVGEELERQKNKLRFPSFITLTGADSTEVTNYRLCLYGALKLKEKKERQAYLKQFTDMVELRYKDVNKELEHLQQYKNIDHLGENTEQKLQQILQFYVKQTFYYILTNSILRLSRCSQQFRPCTIPFNQTYHAIKHYYQKYRKQTGGRSKMVVYRGSKLRTSDMKSLVKGSYIELLGFTSTSLKREEAEKFMDGDSYLIEIHIEGGAQDQKQMLYDHGYVQMNRYSLAAKAFQKEQEVLINALNVFQVISIDLQSTTRTIILKYGAILPLLRSKSTDLMPHDRAVVQNYRYCLNTFDSIEDDGDVLLLSHEHNRCVQYYQGKVDTGEADFKTFGKLAHAQFESGDLDEAYNNALRSLQHLQVSSQTNEEIIKTVNQIKQAQTIFDAKEDYVQYQASVDLCLKLINEDWLQRANLIKGMAEMKLKAGDLAGCQAELKKCRLIIEQKSGSFDQKRKSIEKRYYIRSLCCACSSTSSNQLQEQKELDLIRLQEEQIEFERRKDEMHQLYIQIENLTKERAQQVGNKGMYEQSVKNGQKHFAEMEKEWSIHPIIAAKYKVIEASVVDKNENMPQYQAKMQSAINIVKGYDSFHKNIGIYSNVLGTQQLSSIKHKLQQQTIKAHEAAFIDHNGNLQSEYAAIEDPENRSHQEKFNYQEHDSLRTKCKEVFKEAAANIACNEGMESPDYLSVSNKITEVDFSYCKLYDAGKNGNDTKQLKLVNFHSQGARCYLLLTKISLAKGQLKVAFENVQHSFEILRNALLKVDNKQYNSIFVNNPLYVQINLHKAKIFNRQLKHDLALKQLKFVKKLAEIRMDKHHSCSVLASVYEEQGQIQLFTGETDTFEEIILKAIEIRAIQMGKYNIPNAICYSNLFRFLLSVSDVQVATQYHLKAAEIFSRFPPDHPNSWAIYLSNALLFFERKQFDRSVEELQLCLHVATLRYSSDHIIVMKVNFQFGKMLKKMGQIRRSIEVLKDLEGQVNKCLKQKESAGEKIERQSDDEKFPLLKNVYKEMKDTYEYLNQMQQRDLSALLEFERYNTYLKEFQQMFTTASKNYMQSLTSA